MILRQGRFAPTGHSQYRTPTGRHGQPMHQAPGRPGHPVPPADHRHAPVHSGPPCNILELLVPINVPPHSTNTVQNEANLKFDQPKKKSYADQLTMMNKKLNIERFFLAKGGGKEGSPFPTKCMPNQSR